MKTFDWQTAGDIQKNTKSLELWGKDNTLVADIIRYDDTNHLKLNTYSNELDIVTLERMIELAREHLGDFEDGTHLSAAKLSAEILP